MDWVGHGPLCIGLGDRRMSYDPRYLQGIKYFNECEFFEAHEVWENLWQETEGGSRRFYQGLIQVAVCLHHFGNGNTRGAAKLYHSSRGYLEPFAPWHEGLDINAFLQQLQNLLPIDPGSHGSIGGGDRSGDHP